MNFWGILISAILRYVSTSENRMSEAVRKLDGEDLGSDILEIYEAVKKDDLSLSDFKKQVLKLIQLR